MTNRPSPGPVTGLTQRVTQLATASKTSFVLYEDGSVRSWGDNQSGVLGINKTVANPATSPVQVVGLTSDVTQIAGGYLTAYALLSDGSVRAWGDNNLGQVGNGQPYNCPAPVQVSGLTSGVTQISAGLGNAYVQRADGTVMAWGWNGNGQLGNGSTSNRRTVPVAVPLLSGRAVQRIGSSSTTGQTLLVVTKTS
jgi:alpha-tubulin suppressor-like RCC1 family protein